MFCGSKRSHAGDDVAGHFDAVEKLRIPASWSFMALSGYSSAVNSAFWGKRQLEFAIG